MTTQAAIDPTVWIRSAICEFEAPLIRYAARIVGDQERARDVVQDTFIRLTNQDREKVNGHLPQWLYLSCRNRALDVIRKEKRMVPLDDAIMATKSSGAPTPAANAGRRDEYKQLMAVVNRLPKRQRDLIRMKFLDGMSYREIGKTMNISVSNVGVSLHNAVKRLRNELGKSSDLLATA